MSTVQNPDAVFADATNVVGIWTKNSSIQVKGVTLPDMTANTALLNTTLASITKQENELIPLRNLRDDLARKLHGNCVQLRQAFGGCLGLDSSEVEQAGGTRASERKSPKRKAKGQATAVAAAK
jgi:hypothetical protein